MYVPDMTMRKRRVRKVVYLARTAEQKSKVTEGEQCQIMILL